MFLKDALEKRKSKGKAEYDLVAIHDLNSVGFKLDLSKATKTLSRLLEGKLNGNTVVESQKASCSATACDVTSQK